MDDVPQTSPWWCAGFEPWPCQADPVQVPRYRRWCQVELGIRERQLNARRSEPSANTLPYTTRTVELHSSLLPPEAMPKLCWLPLCLIVLCWLPVVVLSSSSDIQVLKRYAERRTNGGFHIPIMRKSASKMRRRGGQTGVIGLGDFQDQWVIDWTV